MVESIPAAFILRCGLCARSFQHNQPEWRLFSQFGFCFSFSFGFGFFRLLLGSFTLSAFSVLAVSGLAFSFWFFNFGFCFLSRFGLVFYAVFAVFGRFTLGNGFLCFSIVLIYCVRQRLHALLSTYALEVHDFSNQCVFFSSASCWACALRATARCSAWRWRRSSARRSATSRLAASAR